MAEFTTEITIFLGVYFILSFYLFMLLLFKPIEKKYKSVLFPDYGEAQIREKKSKKSFKDKGEKKNRVHSKIDKAVRKRQWDRKIRSIYKRGGNPQRNYEYFILQNLKYLTMGFMAFGMTFVLLGNFLISFVIFALVSSLHVIDMFGDISDRRKDFRNRFPFFLQTLAFVLENGANMNIAFQEVVAKEKAGALREVMSKVQTAWKTNGGDFPEAFKIILEEVDLDETREFVDIIQNNSEKGIPIAKTLGLQSENMAKIINNKKMKKVNGVENKAIVPLLLSFIAIGLFLFFGFTF